MFWKHCSRLKNPVLSSDVEQCWKKPWNTQKTPTKHVLRLFKNFLKIWYSAQKSGSRLRCRTKIYWNTQKTPTKHVLRLFEKFLKIRFSAQKFGSQHRFRTMLKIPWNTQKTPNKHVLRLFKKFLKVRFSAKKSGSRPRYRTMLKILFIQEFLENLVLGSKIRFSAQMSNKNILKHSANTNLTRFETF